MLSDSLCYGSKVTRHIKLEYQNIMVADRKAAISLQELPTKLVAQILGHVTDLETLDSLIRAWPTAYRVFESRAADITDAVLTSGDSSGCICGHIRVIFRIIALLRSGSLPISNLADFQQRVIVDAMRYASRVRSSPNGFAPGSLAEETAPTVIRSLLATYRQIMSASLGCLTLYLDRFKILKPEYPVDKKTKNLQGSKFNRQNIGPPSWVEEQRVNRAFWRLQLLYDLKRAASRGLLDWPEESKAALCDVVAVSRPIGESANSSLRTRRYARKVWANSSDFYHAWVHNFPYAPNNPCPPEYEELISVVDYVGTIYGQAASQRLAKGEMCLAELQGSVEIHRKWPLAKPGAKDWKTLVGPSVGAERHYYGQHGRSILDAVDFDSFGLYGFAFWSWERMFAYGLAARSDGRHENYRVTCAWESILSSEEVEKAR